MKFGLSFIFSFLLYVASFAQLSMWAEGDTIPNFSYKGQFAKAYQLKELKGSYVLINMWASWNEESRKMQLNFIESYARFKDKRFKKGRKFYIISISLDETEEIWSLALKKDNLPWRTHICDLKSWDSELVKLLKIETIPANYLIDPNGIVIARNIKKEQLESILKGL
ncbi:MAG: thioredoxin family protein [bacterium]|nr:thioredoxin family protein [bacterium]